MISQGLPSGQKGLEFWWRSCYKTHEPALCKQGVHRILAGSMVLKPDGSTRPVSLFGLPEDVHGDLCRTRDSLIVECVGSAALEATAPYKGGMLLHGAI